MSVTDLTNAIVGGINAGLEQFLEGTLAAMLPIIWLALLGLELGRPYIMQMIERFTLRLGADLLWLIYVGLRDFLIVSGVVMSFMFLFPDVVTADSLPLTGGLAAACLFGVLLVKLMGDPDHNLRQYRIVLGLEALGALLYFVAYVFGVQFNAVARWLSLRYYCPVCHHGSNSCWLHLDHWWPCRSPRGNNCQLTRL